MPNWTDGASPTESGAPDLTAQDGSKNTLWTNVTLRQFSDGEAAVATTHVFLSEYSPTYVNVEERRERLRAQLAESGGGPLGVEGVKEVIVGVVIIVASLPRAKTFLREKGLLGADSEEAATIDPSKIYGLNIRVVGKER